MIGKRSFFLGNACLALVGISTAVPVPQAPPATEQRSPMEKMGKMALATAMVEKVDRSKRELTLRPTDGKPFTIYVPEDVQCFENVKASDWLTLNYLEAVAITVEKSGAMSKPEEERAVVRWAGTLPSGGVGREVSGTLQLESIDLARNHVTLRDREGNVDTIKVHDEQLAELRTAQRGDRLKVRYTEAVVVSMQLKS